MINSANRKDSLQFVRQSRLAGGFFQFAILARPLMVRHLLWFARTNFLEYKYALYTLARYRNL